MKTKLTLDEMKNLKMGEVVELHFPLHDFLPDIETVRVEGFLDRKQGIVYKGEGVWNILYFKDWQDDHYITKE